MSIKEQLKKITNKIDYNLERVAQAVVIETKTRLMRVTHTLWYGYYEPQDYIRTFDLINSIDGEVIKHRKGKYSIKVFFNDEKINSRVTGNGWNEHAGFSCEEFKAELITSILHGMRGSTNNPRYGDSADIVEVVRKEAEVYANKALRKYLNVI